MIVCVYVDEIRKRNDDDDDCAGSRGRNKRWSERNAEKEDRAAAGSMTGAGMPAERGSVKTN